MIFNELQAQVRKFDKRFGWTDDEPELTTLHMTEELGEISREILRLKGYKPGADTQKLNDEIADLIYLTIKLANSSGLSIDDAWERVEKRYAQK